MANTIAFPIPDLTTPGTLYATEVSNGLAAIQTHDHDGINSGALIDIAAQDIEGDLSLDGYNLSNVRSVQLISQPSTLSGSQDVNSVYVNQNNLGFNNSNGIFVPLTDGNSIAATTLPFTNFSIRSVSAATFSVLATDTYNVIDLDSTGGAITGTLPICAAITPQAAGRLFLFRDVGGAASSHSITIQVAVGSGNLFADDLSTSFVLNSRGGFVALYTDGVSKWFTWSQNTFQGQTLQLNGATLVVNDASQIALTDSSSVQVDASSEIAIAGLLDLSTGAVVFATGITGTITGASAVTYSGTTAEIRATGTTDTRQAGSNLVLDGSINGTTTGGSVALTGTSITTNTLNLIGATTNFGTVANSGTINQSGTLNLSSNSTNLTGHMNVNGGSVLLNSGFITGDVSSTIGCFGFLNLFGVNEAVTLLNAGTYLVDSGSAKDYDIGLLLTFSGTWTINLPASPTNGRHLIIRDASGVSMATPPIYVVQINGNGHNLSNNGPIGSVGGTVTSYTLDASTTGTPNLAPWWHLDFTYVNGTWITPNAVAGF